MKKIIFATSNLNKLKEVQAILKDNYQILSLMDIGFHEEIPEPFYTIKENSIFKANFFYEKTGICCMAEDSGLEVVALHGRPGVFSARYAGEAKNDLANYEKVLDDLKNENNRDAKFVSIISYKSEEFLEVFEGEMIGEITRSPRGCNGFGYDPIFIARGNTLTNAELTIEVKNLQSHRRKALDLLIKFLS